MNKILIIKVDDLEVIPQERLLEKLRIAKHPRINNIKVKNLVKNEIKHRKKHGEWDYNVHN